MAEYQAAERAEGDTTGLHHDLAVAVCDQVCQALAAGIARPPQPAAVVDALTAQYADAFGRPDDAGLRRWLLLAADS